MTRVWLIRHGETEEKARNRCYGSLNIKLSDAGRDQMARVAERLKTETLAAIYSSPRSRAVESAAILARGVEVVPDLAEIDFGDFEGLTYDEISLRYPDIYQEWMSTPTQVQFPNGESFPQMRDRVVNAFQALLAAHQEQSIAIVSHGGVNRILIAWALQMPNAAIFRLAQPYAAVSLVEFVEGVPSLRHLNAI
jgi:alpha-ribazole phosphatase